jgi:hypothetical protein
MLISSLGATKIFEIFPTASPPLGGKRVRVGVDILRSLDLKGTHQKSQLPEKKVRNKRGPWNVQRRWAIFRDKSLHRDRYSFLKR